MDRTLLLLWAAPVRRLRRPTLVFRRYDLQIDIQYHCAREVNNEYIFISTTIQIIFGAFGLPFGLIMTLVTGGELFTGNTALVTAAAMEGKTTKADLMKNWISSYAGNLVGSLLLAYLAFKSGTLGNAPASKSAGI